MKKLLLSTAISLLSFGALAADLPGRSAALAPSPVVVVPAFSWNGFYVGAHAGYMSGDVKVNYGTTPGGGEMKGFVGGALAGYNWQRGSLFYGLEADGSFGSVDGRGKPLPANPPTLTAVDYSYNHNWNGHFRGRLGFAVDRTLFFAAGGLAVAHHKLGEYAQGSMESVHSGTHYGWTIGAGVEQAWSNNFVTRLEYLYDDYGRSTYVRDEGLNVKLTGHTVRAALIWKFGSASAAPVVARY